MRLFPLILLIAVCFAAKASPIPAENIRFGEVKKVLDWVNEYHELKNEHDEIKYIRSHGYGKDMGLLKECLDPVSGILEATHRAFGVLRSDDYSLVSEEKIDVYGHFKPLGFGKSREENSSIIISLISKCDNIINKILNKYGAKKSRVAAKHIQPSSGSGQNQPDTKAVDVSIREITHESETEEGPPSDVAEILNREFQKYKEYMIPSPAPNIREVTELTKSELVTKGLNCFENKDYDCAYINYVRAGELGDGKAYYQLGWMNEAGEVVKANYAAAIDAYEKSVNLEYSKAYNRLGLLFLKGKGAKKDPQLAAKWIRLGAENGDLEAMNNLAYLCLEGIGMPKNASKALEWFVRAANLGHVDAQANAGYLYETGRGIEVNMDKAIHWYQISADGGGDRAKTRLQAIETRQSRSVIVVVSFVLGGLVLAGALYFFLIVIPKLVSANREPMVRHFEKYQPIYIALLGIVILVGFLGIPGTQVSSSAICVEGRWHDDHGTTAAGDTWVITKRGGECILQVYYGGSNPTISRLIVGDKYLHKDESKYPYKHGAYYRVTKDKIKMYDKHGYIRTAYAK